MSPTAFLVSVSIVWLAIGVISSIVLGRRGHDPFRWGLFGAVSGRSWFLWRWQRCAENTVRRRWPLVEGGVLARWMC